MKCVRILPLVVLIAISAAAQSDPWSPVRVFEGKWEGSITGKPGKQFSSREYQFVLHDTFLSQRDHSVYEAKTLDEMPKIREDFGYFSYNTFLKKMVWRQFHSEGFVKRLYRTRPARLPEPTCTLTVGRIRYSTSMRRS